MKKQIMLLIFSAFVTGTMAQNTNEICPRPEQMKIKRAEHQNRRIQLMERELKRIGVNHEEMEQIKTLQKQHREKMSVNEQRIVTLRKTLSKQMNEGASMEVLEASIQDISSVQAEQLRILVSNRIEMERVLGKEKYTQFMKSARIQFKKQGRGRSMRSTKERGRSPSSFEGML